jgi:hypothetical protein
MISVNEDLDCLLIGTERCELLQYNLSSGDLLMDYDNLGMEYLYSCCFNNEFAILGGQFGRFSIVNIKTMKVLENQNKCAVGEVRSILCFKIQQSIFDPEMSTLVAMCGNEKNYVRGKTDLFIWASLNENNKGIQPQRNSFLNMKGSLKSSLMMSFDEDLKLLFKDKRVQTKLSELLASERSRLDSQLREKDSEIRELRVKVTRLENYSNIEFEQLKGLFMKLLQEEYTAYLESSPEEGSNQDKMPFRKFVLKKLELDQEHDQDK